MSGKWQRLMQQSACGHSLCVPHTCPSLIDVTLCAQHHRRCRRYAKDPKLNNALNLIDVADLILKTFKLNVETNKSGV